MFLCRVQADNADQGSVERADRKRRLALVVCLRKFRDAAEEGARTIFSELSVSDEKKRIVPISLGGVAGTAFLSLLTAFIFLCVLLFACLLLFGCLGGTKY